MKIIRKFSSDHIGISLIVAALLIGICCFILGYVYSGYCVNKKAIIEYETKLLYQQRGN
jgi:hypothetical protein